MQTFANTPAILKEVTVHGTLDAVNEELLRIGVSANDVVSVQHSPKPHMNMGNVSQSYRVIFRSTDMG